MRKLKFFNGLVCEEKNKCCLCGKKIHAYEQSAMDYYKGKPAHRTCIVDKIKEESEMRKS